MGTSLRRKHARARIIILVATIFLLAVWKIEQNPLMMPADRMGKEIPSINNTVKVYAPSNSTSNVAICAIVKNETLYLDEWIDFHIALGFSPIYIYDNSLAFDLNLMPHSGVLSWYDSREDIQHHIELIHYPIANVQQKAYDRCIKEDAANSTYVALIDVDEFLVLKTLDNVVDFMDQYCDSECGQLVINWKMMGTSNETHYTPVPVTKRNVYGEEYGTIKTIVRPSYVADPQRWWHSVALKKGYWVDTNGNKRISNGQGGWQRRQANKNGPFNIAALYHYAFKSDEELHYKLCVRGNELKKDGTNKLTFCKSQYYIVHEELQEFDDSAWRQLVRMVPKYRVYEKANQPQSSFKIPPVSFLQRLSDNKASDQSVSVKQDLALVENVDK